MPGTKDDGTKKVAPIDAPNNPTDPEKDKGTPADKGGEDKLIFGRYKTDEDAAKGFKELEGKLGTQGHELRTLRDQVAASQKAAKPTEDKAAAKTADSDYQTQLDDIYAKLESGDISVADAIKQSNALTAETTMAIATNAAGKRTEELLLDKDADAAEKQWHNDYPDYDEVVKSGALQPYIQKSPMLIDETVAYFQYKSDQKYEEGRSKAEEEFKNSAIADSVVKGPGSHRTPIRQTGQKLSEKEIVASQLDRLEKFRASKA